MKSVFTFSASREFLRTYIESLPKKGWGEIQRWADHLGVQTSYVSQVLSGMKNFNVEYSVRLAKYIGLSGLELDYFVLLTEKERAGTVEAQEYFDEKLQRLKKDSRNIADSVTKDKTLSEEEKAEFYSSWIYSAIRLYCSIGSGKTLFQISEHFGITKEACSTILHFLVQSGLCAQKGDKYLMGAQKTHVDKKSAHVRRHWLNWHIQALSRLETVDESELIYSAPFSISKKDFESLQEELTAFIADFVKKVQKTEPQQVAFLNIDLLRLKEP